MTTQIAAETNRRRFQFQLRSLLVAITLLAIGLWFVKSNLLPIRERERVMRTAGVRFNWGARNRFQTKLPLIWCLLGVKCYNFIHFPQPDFKQAELAHLQQLFPEAEVFLYGPNSLGLGLNMDADY